MGELHLDIIRDRMKREFKVEATSGKPQIAYRETVTKASEAEGKFIRQSGGKGQYGHVCVKLEANEKGKGIEIIDEIVGGAIPKEFIKPSIAGDRGEGCNQRHRGRRPPPWSTSLFALLTVRSTTSTRPSSRSRWPASSPSRRR